MHTLADALKKSEGVSPCYGSLLAVPVQVDASVEADRVARDPPPFPGVVVPVPAQDEPRLPVESGSLGARGTRTGPSGPPPSRSPPRTRRTRSTRARSRPHPGAAPRSPPGRTRTASSPRRCPAPPARPARTRSPPPRCLLYHLHDGLPLMVQEVRHPRKRNLKPTVSGSSLTARFMSESGHTVLEHDVHTGSARENEREPLL